MQAIMACSNVTFTFILSTALFYYIESRTGVTCVLILLYSFCSVVLWALVNII